MSWDFVDLKAGDYVADVVLTKKLAVGGGVCVFSARDDDKRSATVCCIVPGVGDAAKDHFLSEASTASQSDELMPNVLPVASVDPIAGAYVASISARFTLAEVRARKWSDETKVEMFLGVCEGVAGLHNSGITHGWLRPENVFIDAASTPFVANARGLHVGDACRVDPVAAQLLKVYSAPEVRLGATATAMADVYSLGRLLHYLLLERDPDEADERLPRMASLKDCDNDLVRIVRHCTTMDPDDRYLDAGALLADLRLVGSGKRVGLPHPDVDKDKPAAKKSPASQARPASMRPPPKYKSQPKSAIDPKRKGKKGKKGKDAAAALWNPKLAVTAAAVGLLLVLSSVLLGYLLVSDHALLLIVSWLSAIPLGFALPIKHQGAKTLRVGAGVVFFAALVFINPVALAKAARKDAAQTSDLAERVVAMKKLLDAGETQFRGIDLAGAELTGTDMSGAMLDRANFRDCKCSGVRLKHASLWNIDVTNADFSGADVSAALPKITTGWEQMTCDGKTTLPRNWVCRDGHPLSTLKK